MPQSLTVYQPPEPELWQGRRDSLPDERYFQKVQCINLKQTPLSKGNETVFLGFASDVGVSRNLGRPGAALGPNALRRHLAGLASHQPDSYLDIGNIAVEGENLEASQEAFATLIADCHAKGRKTIAFGGGHEIAWPHYLGLSERYSEIGIINLDAHFDLRPVSEDGKGSSGTPFSQIAAHCQTKDRPFAYCCLGIQEQANTASLFARARDLKVNVLRAEEIMETPFSEQKHFLDHFLATQKHIYLTLCMDVFATSVAAGVSAPQAFGISPWHALPILKYILQTGKVISIDVAELSPPLDHQTNTAGLAAVLIAKLLEAGF